MEHKLNFFLKIIVISFLLFATPACQPTETESPSLSTTAQDFNANDGKIRIDPPSNVDELPLNFFYRLIVDVSSVLILVLLIYYPIYRRKDFLFTFFLFNIVIFIITYLLNKVEISLGAAFGLFAVFSLLRYRTENISAKDMTYLFVVIAIGLISAVNKGTLLETSLINGIILSVAYTLDANLFIKNENAKKIKYENLELIRPENHNQLLEDLKKRTGLNIHKIKVGRINFLKDTATLTVYYYDAHQKIKQ